MVSLIRTFILPVLAHELHVWHPWFNPFYYIATPLQRYHFLSFSPKVCSSQSCLSQPIFSIHPYFSQSLWNCMNALVISLKHLLEPFNQGLRESTEQMVLPCWCPFILNWRVLHEPPFCQLTDGRIVKPCLQRVHLKDYLVSSSVLPDNKSLIKVICFGLDLKKDI